MPAFEFTSTHKENSRKIVRKSPSATVRKDHHLLYLESNFKLFQANAIERRGFWLLKVFPKLVRNEEG